MGREQVVHYCVDAAPEFGLDTSVVKAAVAEAWALWRNYFARKSIPGLAREARLVSCDGGEDLHLHFATATAAVTAKLALFHDPVAFGCRHDDAVYPDWNHGFIWLGGPRELTLETPEGARPVTLDWHDHTVLIAVLAHELGHVFGAGHVDGTIMDRKIVARLLLTPHAGEVVTIDGTRELVTCQSCADSWPGVFSGDVQFRFAAIMGRAPQGPIEAVVARDAADRWRFDLADGAGARSFPLEPERPAFRVDFAEAIAFASPLGNGGVAQVKSAWAVRLVTALGAPMTLSVERNGDSGSPVALRSQPAKGAATEWFRSRSQ